MNNRSEDLGLEFMQVMALCCGRTPPNYTDSIFVPGRAYDDYEASEYDSGLLQSAVALWETLDNANIVIPGHDGSYKDGQRVSTGYPGFHAWKREIQEECVPRVPDERIVSCVVRRGHERITHTREETDGFVLRAREQSLQTCAVFKYPHQLPRVLASLMRSCELLSYALTAIPIAPQRVDWQRMVYGSRGLLKISRFTSISEEEMRIRRYTEEGEIVPISSVITYLTEPHWLERV